MFLKTVPQRWEQILTLQVSVFYRNVRIMNLTSDMLYAHALQTLEVVFGLFFKRSLQEIMWNALIPNPI